MKKQIIFLATILIGLVVSSCTQSDSLTDSQKEEKQIQAKGSYSLTTNFSNESIDLINLSSFNSIVENFGIYKEISTQQTILNESDFTTLLNDFTSFYSLDLSAYNLRGIVFYGDNVSIDLDDFRNMTLIVLDSEGYASYISYEKQGSNLVVVDDNPQKHSFIMMNYFGYLGASYRFI